MLTESQMLLTVQSALLQNLIGKGQSTVFPTRQAAARFAGGCCFSAVLTLAAVWPAGNVVDDELDAAPGDILEREGQPSFRSRQTAWGAVVSFQRMGSRAEEDAQEASFSGRGKEQQWVVDVLVNTAPKNQPGHAPRK